MKTLPLKSGGEKPEIVLEIRLEELGRSEKVMVKRLTISDFIELVHSIKCQQELFQDMLIVSDNLRGKENE